MSENITHTAVLDDCFRLMRAAGEGAFCAPFLDAARDHLDTARLAAVTRGGDGFTAPLLDDFRGRWPRRAPGDGLEAKLAFVLGWLCHRAADRQMKPLFRELEPGRPVKPAETSVYNDAFLFREVYAGGRDAPYHPAMWEDELRSLPGAAGIDVPAVEELLRVLLQRALLEMHTLIPDRADPEGWMDRLFALRQVYSVDRARYAEAILRPDPEKVRRYLVEPNFYDPAEPIIAAARRVQKGGGDGAVPPGDVLAAMDAEPASHYAQILRRGCDYLKAGSDFFAADPSDPGVYTREWLSDRFDIGRAGRDGKSV